MVSALAAVPVTNQTSKPVLTIKVTGFLSERKQTPAHRPVVFSPMANIVLPPEALAVGVKPKVAAAVFLQAVATLVAAGQLGASGFLTRQFPILPVPTAVALVPLPPKQAAPIALGISVLGSASERLMLFNKE